MSRQDARSILARARLLLVTDPRPDLADRVEAAVRGGVDVVQLRDEHASRDDLIPLSAELKEICERGGALFTVNGDVRLARISGAAGVHLGRADANTRDVRALLGPGAIVGRSAGTLGQALDEVRDGADYLGVGAVYATPTKPEGDAGGLKLVYEVARAGLPIPWFAIGGVTLETAPEVAAAGASGFAVVRAILDAEDPEAAARRLRSHLPG